jgi:hypothetical protein
MPVALFQTAMPTSEMLQTHAVDRAVNGINSLTLGLLAGYKMYPYFIFSLTALGGT